MGIQLTLLSRILLAMAIGITVIIGLTKLANGKLPWELNASPSPSNISEQVEQTQEVVAVSKASVDFDQLCQNNIMLTSACQKALEMLLDRFPGIQLEMVDWKKLPKLYNCSSSSGYEAVFADNNRIIEAEFDLNGYLLEIEYENMPFREVPQPVKAAFLAAFPNQNVTTFELEVMPNGQKFYEFEVHSSTDTDVTFDENGNRVSNNSCED